ncbi:molybdopterin molybdotransferase MoeA [Streptomyces sp. 549]|uniref:molybdopterin molybdotransferase MoeA n=1 Tax=Streptomyces sp. 549 TaxID=3049076 RepID=UPI0024C2A9FE|nr:molybdopterin molybdotransferase MoeA [Streptomyces sp. 549]MDK1473219.1 molybdopterin molybdotransferase MoeA [Streptomyces sp. 549]
MSDDFDDALALANGSTAAAVTRPRRAEPGAADPASSAACAWEQARATAARTGTPGDPVVLPLAAALHHSLSAPLTALTDLPAFDTSAMDGWAVSGPGPWRLGEEPCVLAGDDPGPLPDGRAVAIATGARIPPGATAVLRSEHGVAAGNRLSAVSALPDGTDIRARGQECRTRDLLLHASEPVTPAVLGLAAAAGYDELEVTPLPRVEVLVLGDELLTEGVPGEGRVRDALGPLLAPWLTALGAEVVATRHLGDDAEALHRAVRESTADVLVTTGGTAAGPVDHVHRTLERVGATLLVDGVAVRPGHPMLLAELPAPQPGRRTRHLVGLPGNPLAAVSGLLTLAEPLLRTLADRPAEAEQAAARLTEAVPGHPHDTRLVPVAMVTGGKASPLRYQGPAMLRGIASAAAMAVVPPGGAASGSVVRLLRLPWNRTWE